MILLAPEQMLTGFSWDLQVKDNYTHLTKLVLGQAAFLTFYTQVFKACFDSRQKCWMRLEQFLHRRNSEYRMTDWADCSRNIYWCLLAEWICWLLGNEKQKMKCTRKNSMTNMMTWILVMNIFFIHWELIELVVLEAEISDGPLRSLMAGRARFLHAERKGVLGWERWQPNQYPRKNTGKKWLEKEWKKHFI